MKCYVLLRMFEDLFLHKVIRKEECMADFSLSTSTFMRYVRNLRAYCEKRGLGKVVYDRNNKEYKLV